jgi:hypothetical protein
MAESVVKMLEQMVAERRAVSDKEHQVVQELNRVLREMGYQVVPIAAAEPELAAGSETGDGMARGNGMPGAAPRAARPARSSRPSARPTSRSKPLSCPHCERTFSLPLHLGRHVAAMHKRKASRKAA